MLTLRLTQHTDSPDRYHVEFALEGDGLPRLQFPFCRSIWA